MQLPTNFARRWFRRREFVLLIAVCLVWTGSLALRAQASQVIIVAGSHTFHQSGCAQIASYSESHVRTVARSSLESSYTPCAVCQPDAKAPGPAAVSATELEAFWSRYDPAETVSIVTGDNATGMYHRRGCWWLTSGLTRTFTRKDAESRIFQAHQECFRKAPNTNSRPPATATSTSPPASSPARPLVDVEAARPAAPRARGPVLQDTERQQCAATTRKGTRCSRLAQPGRTFCWQH
jgi:hypothetical protein